MCPRGSAPNKRDEMIAAHNRHTSFNPKCYQLVYIGQPNDGNAFWVLTAGAAGAACQVVNDKGVSLILNAGGNQHAAQHANAFGVSWFLLFLHAAAYADTADQHKGYFILFCKVQELVGFISTDRDVLATLLGAGITRSDEEFV